MLYLDNNGDCEKYEDIHVPNFKVRLYNVVGAREYKLPTGDMLGAIVYEPGPESDMDYDIVLEERSGYPQRVNKLHPSYMSLQFPLLFIYRQDGYSKELRMIGTTGSSSEQKRLTMKAYYSYYLHDCANCYNYLSRTGRLFQQYVVTAFCAIEQHRIDYIREHQNDIRNEYLSGIYDAINQGDNDGSNCGAKLILPQSFVGGPRYMYSHYLDALAICRVHGNPSFFITFTCNVKWPEITEYMAEYPQLTTTDRADIVDRVFEMKIHQFIHYLRDAQPFGKTVAVLYTVEFQKRGLPHCHTLLWIDESVRVRRDEDIDIYISAELPSKETDPECHRIVSELMMHRPCGLAYPSASCMQNSSRCKKNFPKEYCGRTYIDKNGFVHYKRRDTGVTTFKQDIELDNGYVNMQRVVFKERDKLDSIVVNPYRKKTTLTEWLYYNEHNTYGRHLTYLNFPSEFVWYADGKYWRRRRMRNKSSIGRLIYVHPASGDLFYQRMLLSHQKGCTSFPGIRTINDIVYPTCRAACEALGLLEDDREWETTLKEAVVTATPAELRTLLAHILSFCQVSDPIRLWKHTWKSMSGDIPYTSSISLDIPDLQVDDSELEEYVLYELESCLNHCLKSLTDFGLPLPPEHLMSVLRNKLLMEEKCYDRQLLAKERDRLLPKLNDKQRHIFSLIIQACLNNTQELVFVYGHGGTGKTFLWKSIIYALRCEGRIVLAVASSGIASLLLPAGRTAHSRFKLPLDPTDTSVCAIKKNTQLATLLKETRLIIWDESPMNDRRCFETLDRTLRDILDEPNRLFEGKTVMLGGDFRQTLPVKKSATRDDIIRSSVAKSYIWHHFKVHYLTENMRLNHNHLQLIDRQKVSIFAQWLLDIGNGHIGTPDESDPENTSWINIPDEYCIPKKMGRTHTYISVDDVVPHGHDGGEVELLKMASTSNIDKAREDKGKMVIAEPEVTNIADLRPIHSNKTIEIVGTLIQANMDVKDAYYFDQSLQLQRAYRISTSVKIVKKMKHDD
ncbi:DNA helicase [Tanacetum coccineum]